MAGGIDCTTDDGLRVDIYNKMNADKKWVAAALLITSDEEGTLLTRRGKEIKEEDKPGVDIYSARANASLFATRLVIEIPTRAGDLDKGEPRGPKLILLNDDERNVRELTCRTF